MSDTLHDADLLARVAMHDTQALSDLYDRFAPILYGVAVKMLRSEAEAEDVLQEVFLKVWEKAGSYDAHLGSPFAWLITLLRNRAHDRLRALGRQYRAFDSLGTDAQSGSMDSLTPTHSLLREEISSLMREALNQLPRDQREAIELAFLGGLTQNEIAEQLQQPLGTIKARIRRGMIALRDHLPPEWWPNGGIMDWNQSPGSSSKGHSNEEAP